MGKAAAQARPTAVFRENGLVHRSKARGLLDTSNLPALQNLLKRDPAAYEEEFLAQWNQYESLRRIYASGIGQHIEGATDAGMQTLRLSKEQQDQFEHLLTFVAHLAPSYPKLTAPLPDHIAELLLTHHASLSPDLRKTCFRCMSLLRSRGVIADETLLRTLFPLLSLVSSSELRTAILSTIVQNLKQANRKTKDVRLNRMVQGLLFGMVERGMSDAEGNVPAVLRPGEAELKGRSEALWAVRIAAEMWRRRIWTDERTVALLALACTHPHPKVQGSAVRFFLGDLHTAENAENSDGEEDSDEGPSQSVDVGRLKHQRKVGKKTKAGDRRLKLAQAHAKRRRKENEEKAWEKVDKDSSNMAAIHLLHDPQTFAERVFENLLRGDKRHPLEMKVRIVQLLSRVMGIHRLIVLSFYSYLAKYFMPHQLHITLILVSLAQSVHDQTPTDVLTPAIRKIAYAFVHPGVTVEVVAAGINTIREVCRRQPWCMEEDLLHDLVEYRKSKDKGVSAASRGLMQLYREVNPALLRRADRGKSGAMAMQEGKQVLQFGEDRRQVHGIQGLDLLEKQLEENQDEEDEEDWDGWEVESDSGDDSDGSGGWINVTSDDEDNGHVFSDDSDDECDEEKIQDTRPASEKVREARKLRRETQKQKQECDSDEEDQEGVAVPTAPATESEDAFSALAMNRILTPADFAKMNELRLKAAEEAVKTGGALSATARRELEALQAAKKRTGTSGTSDVVNESDILGPRKKVKATYEERMKSIETGREGREKFGSRKGKKNKDVASSSTNRQKARGKNFHVRSKKNASLREKSKRLRKHITEGKKARNS
ncbi:Severe Depolymerization of Actin [Malassezia vespertilionis]|uniref:Protein SDA1 n=1 Tax=Malassezia vespertilionis TaxID=2020962 RepID=A0A2N1JBT3_9BASI|nr:Severe Depolymerization of Actin [Malassezia vespertilionis]PKI84011.1 Sda1p [Malassezia vespertilionis]WFD06811.1 Severe Depolymerization of Actin [Malassezia vespertilionis]